MKKKLPTPRIISLCLMAVIGLSGYVINQSLSSAAQSATSLSPPLKEIAGYRNWAKVNSEPQLMPDPAAQLCGVAISPGGVMVFGEKNPHRHKYLNVFVNGLGRKAMLEEQAPSFPIGSVIVKEKLPEKSSQTPELMTVMIKRGKGFNPANGNWEYMVVDGTATRVMAQGKLENCQACHIAKPETDYVFRTYLPAEVLSKLK